MNGLGSLMSVAIGAGIIIAVLFAVLAYLRSKGLGYARRSGRITISDYLDLDKNRRLLLVRRDNVEHLVILGSNGETVVETGIEAPPEAVAVPTAAPASPLRAAPRPVKPLGPVFRAVMPARSEEPRAEPVLGENKDGRSDPELPG